MDRLYRFSPITSKAGLLEAVMYTANKSTELSKKITNNQYPIASLTIFSHYPNEFEELKKFILELGNLHTENNGPFVKLSEPIQLSNVKLDLLRIRKPDPYRMQVGCNDFSVPDYPEFKERYLKSTSSNLRLIERPEYEMIELFDPDFDVLAYVLSKQLV